MTDALGERLRMFDKSGTTSLELLRFRPELVAVRGFEEALRDRVALLRTFKSPAFAPAWAVDKLEGDRLALVSTYADGKRLAEIVASPREPSGVNPLAAAWLVRDLTSALADLQRHHDGLAHGVLTPERIVMTPDGRLVIVEHVLGAALDRLRWTPSSVSEKFSLVAIDGGEGIVRLDQRSDVIQLGWIVLSVLVGRRLTATDYPQRVEELLGEFVRSAPPPQALVTALRSWLERALQVKGAGFGSAVEAHDALFDLRLHDGPQAVAFEAGRQAKTPLTAEMPRPEPPAERAAAEPAATESVSVQPISVQPISAEPISAEPISAEPISAEPIPAEPIPAEPIPAEPIPAEPIPAEPMPAEPMPAEPIPAEPMPSEPAFAPALPAQPMFVERAEPLPTTLDLPEIPAVDISSEAPPTTVIATMTGPDAIAELRAGIREKEIFNADAHAEREAGPRRRLGWIAALALVAIAEGVALSWLYVARATPATGAKPIVLESMTPGDPVLVNGWQAGLTPLTLTLTPEVRSIRVQARASEPAIDAPVVKAAREPERPAPEPETRVQPVESVERRGGLRIVSTPVDVQVLEGEQVLGSAIDGPIMITAGRRELDFINSAVGYRSRRVVDIVAGRTVRVNIAIPDGRLSVNALPWAQVLIDGDPVGETPLANLPLAVGEHQVTFRHPQLGEQTQRVTVKADGLTRVSATLSR